MTLPDAWWLRLVIWLVAVFVAWNIGWTFGEALSVDDNGEGLGAISHVVVGASIFGALGVILASVVANTDIRWIWIITGIPLVVLASLTFFGAVLAVVPWTVALVRMLRGSPSP